MWKSPEIVRISSQTTVTYMLEIDEKRIARALSPIPPDPTPISSMILLIPFIIIFEAVVLAAKRVDKQRAMTSH